jgi:hypothetical protein|tara:strand:+ start:224 stop:421 length:198 start_codon:yes stop_codon:yes gene_type:complete
LGKKFFPTFILGIILGRKRIYRTKKEQLDARRTRQRRYYWKNRESILEKKKKAYWLKKYKVYEEL